MVFKKNKIKKLGHNQIINQIDLIRSKTKKIDQKFTKAGENREIWAEIWTKKTNFGKKSYSSKFIFYLLNFFENFD